MPNDQSFAVELGRRVKWTSLLRGVPASTPLDCRPLPAFTGDLGLFELTADSAPVIVESVSGRFMTVLPGDLFLAAPGFRESTRWVVGHVPDSGLQPGAEYWVLADCGLVGELDGTSVLPKLHLGRARMVGVIAGPEGRALNLSGFAPLAAPGPGPDQGAPVTAILGTSSEVGKTTAGLAVLQTLRSHGQDTVVALKATGTASVQEIARYADHGARHTFDCVDFGLPTTYPSGRSGIGAVFETALAHVLALRADAVLVEFGGDLFGANVPVCLEILKRRRPGMRIVLAASDAAAALGSKSVLDRMGLEIGFFTGPCTDTPTLRERTERLCGRTAMNLLAPGPRAMVPALEVHPA